MNLEHLALVVSDQQRARRFYETFFGFDEGQMTHHEDGTLIIRNRYGFALALHPVHEVPPQAEFSHFGFAMRDADSVRKMQSRFENEGLRIVETNDEPGYVSFKCLDPDGYKIEVSWEELD